MDFLCKNCNHSFNWHQQATFELWYCDFEGSCQCNYFERKQAADAGREDIKVQYENDSYRWN